MRIFPIGESPGPVVILPSSSPVSPPPPPTPAQVISELSLIEAAQSKADGILAAAASVKNAQIKDGTYNEQTFAQALVLWETTQHSASGNEDVITAAGAQATQDQLNTLLSSPAVLQNAITALQAPAPAQLPQSSADALYNLLLQVDPSASDPATITQNQSLLWQALQSFGVTPAMLQNQLYYQDAIDQAVGEVLGCYQQLGCSQSDLDTLATNLDAALAVQQVSQSAAAGSNPTATISALDSVLSGQDPTSAYYKAVMANTVIQGDLTNAENWIVQQTVTAEGNGNTTAGLTKLSNALSAFQQDTTLYSTLTTAVLQNGAVQQLLNSAAATQDVCSSDALASFANLLAPLANTPAVANALTQIKLANGNTIEQQILELIGTGNTSTYYQSVAQLYAELGGSSTATGFAVYQAVAQRLNGPHPVFNVLLTNANTELNGGLPMAPLTPFGSKNLNYGIGDAASNGDNSLWEDLLNGLSNPPTGSTAKPFTTPLTPSVAKEVRAETGIPAGVGPAPTATTLSSAQTWVLAYAQATPGDASTKLAALAHGLSYFQNDGFYTQLVDAIAGNAYTQQLWNKAVPSSLTANDSNSADLAKIVSILQPIGQNDAAFADVMAEKVLLPLTLHIINTYSVTDAYSGAGGDTAADQLAAFQAAVSEIYTAVGGSSSPDGQSILTAMTKRLNTPDVLKLVTTYDTGKYSSSTTTTYGMAQAISQGGDAQFFEDLLNGYIATTADGSTVTVKSGLHNPVATELRQETGITDTAPSTNTSTTMTAAERMATKTQLINLVGQELNLPAIQPTTAQEKAAAAQGTFVAYSLSTDVYGDVTLGQLINQIEAIGGPNPIIQALPFTFIPQGGDGADSQSLQVFKVQSATTGQTYYVGPNGTAQIDWQTWVNQNNLGNGEISYLQGGNYTLNTDGSVEATYNTHVTDNHGPWYSWSNIKWAAGEIAIAAIAVAVAVCTAGAAAPEEAAAAAAVEATEAEAAAEAAEVATEEIAEAEAATAASSQSAEAASTAEATQATAATSETETIAATENAATETGAANATTDAAAASTETTVAAESAESEVADQAATAARASIRSMIARGGKILFDLQAIQQSEQAVQSLWETHGKSWQDWLMLGVSVFGFADVVSGLGKTGIVVLTRLSQMEKIAGALETFPKIEESAASLAMDLNKGTTVFDKIGKFAEKPYIAWPGLLLNLGLTGVQNIQLLDQWRDASFKDKVDVAVFDIAFVAGIAGGVKANGKHGSSASSDDPSTSVDGHGSAIVETAAAPANDTVDTPTATLTIVVIRLSSSDAVKPELTLPDGTLPIALAEDGTITLPSSPPAATITGSPFIASAAVEEAMASQTLSPKTSVDPASTDQPVHPNGRRNRRRPTIDRPARGDTGTGPGRAGLFRRRADGTGSASLVGASGGGTGPSTMTAGSGLKADVFVRNASTSSSAVPSGQSTGDPALVTACASTELTVYNNTAGNGDGDAGKPNAGSTRASRDSTRASETANETRNEAGSRGGGIGGGAASASGTAIPVSWAKRPPAMPDKSLIGIALVRSPSDHFKLVAASNESGSALLDENGDELTPHQLVVAHFWEWDGKPIFLAADETGQGDPAFAQHLSNITGAKVLAPISALRFRPNEIMTVDSEWRLFEPDEEGAFPLQDALTAASLITGDRTRLSSAIPFEDALGRYVGAGADKVVVELGQDMVAAFADPAVHAHDGQEFLSAEDAAIAKLASAGVPVTQIFGFAKIHGFDALVCKRYAAGATGLRGPGNTEIASGGLLNQKSLSDLIRIREAFVNEGIHVEDPQFLIDFDGSVVVADPRTVELGTTPSQYSLTVLDNLIAAARANSGPDEVQQDTTLPPDSSDLNAAYLEPRQPDSLLASRNDPRAAALIRPPQRFGLDFDPLTPGNPRTQVTTLRDRVEADVLAPFVGDIGTPSDDYWTPDFQHYANFIQAAQQIGVTDPTEIRALYTALPRDTVTGFTDATQGRLKADMARKAQRIVASTCDNAYFLSFELINLKGLNKAMHDVAAEANKHFHAIATIVQRSAASISPDAVLLRTGGPRFGAFLRGPIDEEAVRRAIANMQSQVQTYAEANGLADIPHPSDPAITGVSIQVKYSQIRPDSTLDEIFGTAATDSGRGVSNVSGSEGSASRDSRAAAGAARAKGSRDGSRVGEATGGSGGAFGVAARLASGSAEGSTERLTVEDLQALVDPTVEALYAFIVKGRQHGLSETQLEQLAPWALPMRDDVTGFYAGGVDHMKARTVERAQSYVEESDDGSAYFVSGDVANLSGLNQHFADNRELANAHFRNMAHLVLTVLRKTGALVVEQRTGGDEIGFVVAGRIDRDTIEAALVAAKADVTQYVADNGLSEIPHTKEPTNEARKGVGIHLGYAPVQPDLTLDHIFKEADLGVNRSKEGRGFRADTAERAPGNPRAFIAPSATDVSLSAVVEDTQTGGPFKPVPLSYEYDDSSLGPAVVGLDLENEVYVRVMLDDRTGLHAAGPFYQDDVVVTDAFSGTLPSGSGSRIIATILKEKQIFPRNRLVFRNVINDETLTHFARSGAAADSLLGRMGEKVARYIGREIDRQYFQFSIDGSGKVSLDLYFDLTPETPPTPQRGIYVSRPVDPESAARLLALAQDPWVQAILGSTDNLVPPDKMHVTIVRSSNDLRPGATFEPQTDPIEIPAGQWVLRRLGNGAVLRFDAPALAARWSEARDLGAGWSYEGGYVAHVTLSYACPPFEDVELAGIGIDAFPLTLGSEQVAPFDANWVERNGLDGAPDTAAAHTDGPSHGFWPQSPQNYSDLVLNPLPAGTEVLVLEPATASATPATVEAAPAANVPLSRAGALLMRLIGPFDRNGLLTQQLIDLCGQSPILLTALQSAADHGWRIIWTNSAHLPGASDEQFMTGSYIDRRTKVIALSSSSPEQVLNALIHELGHFVGETPTASLEPGQPSFPQPADFASGNAFAEAYVAAHLDDEGNADLFSRQVAAEMGGNGGAASTAADPKQQTIFEQYRDGALTWAGAAHALGLLHGSEHPSVAPDVTYEEWLAAQAQHDWSQVRSPSPPGALPSLPIAPAAPTTVRHEIDDTQQSLLVQAADSEELAEAARHGYLPSGKRVYIYAADVRGNLPKRWRARATVDGNGEIIVEDRHNAGVPLATYLEREGLTQSGRLVIASNDASRSIRKGGKFFYDVFEPLQRPTRAAALDLRPELVANRFSTAEDKPGGRWPGSVIREARSDQLFMVKWYESEDQARNAVAVSQSYRAWFGMGAAADLRLVTWIDPVSGKQAYGVMTAINDVKYLRPRGAKALLAPKRARVNGLYDAVPGHVLFQNTDPGGEDLSNILAAAHHLGGPTKGQTAFHVDLDSAYVFNADGKSRQYETFGADGIEAAFEAFRTANSDYYGQMTRDDFIMAIDHGRDQLAAARTDIRQAIMAHGAGSISARRALADRVDANITALLEWRDAQVDHGRTGGTLPEAYGYAVLVKRGNSGAFDRAYAARRNVDKHEQRGLSRRTATGAFLAYNRNKPLFPNPLGELDAPRSSGVVLPTATTTLDEAQFGKLVYVETDKNTPRTALAQNAATLRGEDPNNRSPQLSFAEVTGKVTPQAPTATRFYGFRADADGNPLPGQPLGYLTLNKDGQLAWFGRTLLTRRQRIIVAVKTVVLAGLSAAGFLTYDLAAPLRSAGKFGTDLSMFRYSVNFTQLFPQLREHALSEVQAGHLVYARSIINAFYRSVTRYANHNKVSKESVAHIKDLTERHLGAVQWARTSAAIDPTTGELERSTIVMRTEAYFSEVERTLGMPIAKMDPFHPSTLSGRSIRSLLIASFGFSESIQVRTILMHLSSKAAGLSLQLSGAVFNSVGFAFQIGWMAFETAFARTVEPTRADSARYMKAKARIGRIATYSFVSGYVTDAISQVRTHGPLWAIGADMGLSTLNIAASHWDKLAGNEETILVYRRSTASDELTRDKLVGYATRRTNAKKVTWRPAINNGAEFGTPIRNVSLSDVRQIRQDDTLVVSRAIKDDEIPDHVMPTTDQPATSAVGKDEYVELTPTKLRARIAIQSNNKTPRLVLVAATVAVSLSYALAKLTSSSSPSPHAAGQPKKKKKKSSATKPASPPPPLPPVQPYKIVTVTSRETLWGAAADNGDDLDIPANLQQFEALNSQYDWRLLDGNPDTPRQPGDGRDPDLIYSGDKVKVPTAPISSL